MKRLERGFTPPNKFSLCFIGKDNMKRNIMIQKNSRFVTKKNLRGFTLIELLVVIAIIGILSSVVLASLNTARAKGANAAVKSNLANIRAQMEIVYDGVNPNSYATGCTSTTVANALTSAGAAGGVTPKCYNASGTWVAAAQLKVADDSAGTLTHWCVDSAGKSRAITTAQYGAITTAATLCP